MIATGTDVKPLECVFFHARSEVPDVLRADEGRGVRVINPTDLQQVTPDARIKDHFVIIDAVGVTETQLQWTTKPSIASRTFLWTDSSRSWLSANVIPILSPPSPIGLPGSTFASARLTE